MIILLIYISFRYAAAVLWISFPDSFRKCSNFNHFKALISGAGYCGPKNVLRYIAIYCNIKKGTVDGFIFVGTNFRGLKKNQTFVGFKIRGHSIFLNSSYRKSLFRWH